MLMLLLDRGWKSANEVLFPGIKVMRSFLGLAVVAYRLS
jgi:hypothetical protein